MRLRRFATIVLLILSAGAAYSQESADSVIVQVHPLTMRDSLRSSIKGVPGIEFSCYGGWGHRFAKKYESEDGDLSYHNHQRDAFVYGGKIVVSGGVFGAGLMVNRYHTNGRSIYTPEKEQVDLLTAGFIISLRFAIKNDNCVLKFNAGPGKIYYTRHLETIERGGDKDTRTTKDECWARIIEGGVSFRLSGAIFLDLNASWIGGELESWVTDSIFNYSSSGGYYSPFTHKKAGWGYDMRHLLLTAGLTYLF